MSTKAANILPGWSARAQCRAGGLLLCSLLLPFPILAESSTPINPPERPSPVSDAPVSFRNDVMAVLSKAGCNAGTCHGNKNGKGGFKLSLRGQEPERDHLSLTRDLLGRRTDPLQPDHSLILLKPTAQIAHEGGLRFKRDSIEYQLVRRWVAQGMPNDLSTAPRLTHLEVSPAEVVLIEPDHQLQLHVQATFSDGSGRDVTSLTVYEPSNKKVEISPVGLVQAHQEGETTVLVRYLDRQEPVRLAFVPARPQFKWSPSPTRNYIDEHLFDKLRTLRINPSEFCSDRVFLRRAYLDLLGILPTGEEAQAFLADPYTGKREELIDQLLRRPEFADFWALKWADLLQLEAHSLDNKGVQNFHHWIRQSIAQNKPINQFVHELVSARGSTYTSPPANYYRPNRDPATRAKAVAQVFLGTRLQCAQCHNHPFDRWTQDDYYDWAGLFARLNYKVLENNRDIGSDQHEWKGEQIVFLSREGSIKNPRTGKAALPRLLGSSQTQPHDNPDLLLTLADWLTRPENTRFAQVQANRIWYHLMGRGLVDPPDDFRATNPASHPRLLDALATDLVRHQFDMRYLIRLIMSSRAYQLDSSPNDTNQNDDSNFSRVLVRRLSAEQLLDCQSQIVGAPLTFAGFPPGLRAAQLPGVRPEGKRNRRTDPLQLLLETFGKPPRLVSSDTERSCECNMAQAFQMLNGPGLNQWLAAPENRITRFLQAGKSNQDIFEELWWIALNRLPTPTELDTLLPDLVAASDRRAALEDILWGILNSREFLFRY